MAIITFTSDGKRETGQTLSCVAFATQMAIEHNYRILLVSTAFQENILEACYWDLNRTETTAKKIVTDSAQQQAGIESGIEGLLKIIASNRTSTDIVRNYTKVVFKERLDVLFAPKTDNFNDYLQMTTQYVDVLQTANRCYDMVIVDLNKQVEPNAKRAILDNSDVVIYNLIQNLGVINHFKDMREADEFYRKRNIMVALGKYDRFSKYNIKNVSKYLRERKEVNVIPYCTLFFESAKEGTVVDYFLSIRKLSDEEDRNVVFVKDVEKMCNDVVYKLQELQMRM